MAGDDESNDEPRPVAVAPVVQAARDGNAIEMVEALFRGRIPDGLYRRIARMWPRLHPSEVDQVVARAIDALYDTVQKGTPVLFVESFLWKVSERRAADCDRRHRRTPMELVDPNDLPKAVQPQDPAQDILEPDPDDGDPRDQLRAEALVIARRLLPRIGQEQVQMVMSFVLDAVEAGREDLPSREIGDALGLTPNAVRALMSRGFQRLSRLAREEGLVDGDLPLSLGDVAGPMDNDTHERPGGVASLRLQDGGDEDES